MFEVILFERPPDVKIHLMTILSNRTRNQIIKIDRWYEDVVPNMMPREFRRFFRMNDTTLNGLVQFVHNSPFLQSERSHAIELSKKVGMCCTYLGTITPTHQ